jgi:arginase
MALEEEARMTAPVETARGATPVELLLVPYDSGLRGQRMGAGPLRLEEGLTQALRGRGHPVERTPLQLAEGAFPAEVSAAFSLNRALAGRVRASVESGRLPLVLSGNCNATVGVLAGLHGAGAGERVGVVWFDAHGDFNTPETSRSGFLDGMALAMLTARCWRTGCDSIPGFRAVPEEAVLLVGARDLDPQEAVALAASRVQHLGVKALREGGLAPALERLAGRVDALHLHVDLDVHDPDRVAPANGYAAPDGLGAEEVLESVRLLAQRLPLRSATLAAWDPSLDREGRLLRAAVELGALVAQLAARA